MHDSTSLRGLKNIGPTIAARLEAVGIKTVGNLRAIGPAEAYKRVKASHPDVTIPVCYYLYSLQGTLDGIHWDALAPTMKEKLLLEVGAPDKSLHRTRRKVARR